MRPLAAAVLASALTDLLKGRHTAEILSWIQGCPAALPFWMACHWLDISPLETRVRLEKMAANPGAYRGLSRYPTSRRGSRGGAARY